MSVSEFSISENSSNHFDDGFVRREFYKSLNGQLNPSIFGADSIEQIFAREHERRYLVDRPKSFRNTRRRKRDRKGDDAVVYLNLEGGNGGEACPSIADSSAVSLSQMAFLSMTVSIFSVVASIANNLNNNNNNNNDNNINFIQQKQNNLNMNQNIVNQINIDLPPPVPGKRSLADVDAGNKIRAMVERKFATWRRSRSTGSCRMTDLSPDAAAAMVNILRSSMTKRNEKILDTPHTRECLGRELCLRSAAASHSTSESPVQRVVYLLESFAMLFVELDDKTESFGDFLQRMTSQDRDPDVADCFRLFPGCGEPDIYTLTSM